MQINSYNTHQFTVRFLKHIPDVEVSFTKGPREEVVTIRYDPENGMTVRQTTKFDEIMETVKETTKACSDLSGDEFAACVANGVIDDVTKLTDTKSQIGKYRDQMSARLRNYTCVDEKMDTTEPIKSYKYAADGNEYFVDTLLDSSNAKIWMVNNFVSQEECRVLMDHGLPRLRRATVAAEDGSSVVSENRKAQQASYNMHSRTPEQDPLW